ncbi:hypothetical protein H4R33_007225, partial [Dimargaris cristalligena]
TATGDASGQGPCRQTHQVKLPRTLELLDHHFTVETVLTGKLTTLSRHSIATFLSSSLELFSQQPVCPRGLYMEDSLNADVIRQRSLLLYNNPYTTRLGPTYQANPSSRSSATDQLGTIQNLIKMTLLTPARRYNPLVAYEMIQSCEQPDVLENSPVDQAIALLKERRVILKVKHHHHRNVPGRGFSVSEPFLATVVTHYPRDFFAQSRALVAQFQKAHHRGDLSHPGCSGSGGGDKDVRTFISPFIAQGGMGILLEWLAGGQATLDLVPLQNVPGINVEFFRNFYRKTRSLFPPIAPYDFYVTPPQVSTPKGLPVPEKPTGGLLPISTDSSEGKTPESEAVLKSLENLVSQRG